MVSYLIVEYGVAYPMVSYPIVSYIQLDIQWFYNLYLHRRLHISNGYIPYICIGDYIYTMVSYPIVSYIQLHIQWFYNL